MRRRFRDLPGIRVVRDTVRLLRSRGVLGQPSYESRLSAERHVFDDQAEVHGLPPIAHYWSNTFLRPMEESFGFSNPDEFFALYLRHAAADAGQRPARFVSLGCGNCDTEVRVARMLRDQGMHDFVLECVDLNAMMLERGVTLAREAGLEEHIQPRQAEFNAWQPDGMYDAVIANQSLHHVLKLEDLFAAVSRALPAHGRFITSDMIGRNGHMRWPEAMRVVHEFWRELPKKYRYNLQLHRYERRLKYWDCSIVGFEGVRAQDILPLLVERFDFELFLPYGNVIDPFIDRSFGPHFDADADWDRNFIDRVQARDEAEIQAGHLSPTHMMAVMRKRPYRGRMSCRGHLTPEFCIRRS